MFEKRSLKFIGLAAALVAMAAAAMVLATESSQGEPITLEPPDTYGVKDGPAQIVVGVQGKTLAYVAVTVSREKKVNNIPGDEFAIGLKNGELTPQDFEVVEAKQNGPGSLDLELRCPRPALDLTIHYRQDPGSFFIRKWIELKPAPGESLFVDSIVLQRFKPWAEPRAFSGPGQPVYVGDTFWGVAYPSADNKVLPDKTVECSYLVGLEVGNEGYVSRESIYGLARPGMVKEDFLDYIDRVRARPVRPFLLYNTWYDLRTFSADEVIKSIAGFKKELYEPYGIGLDSVVLDDGWDDYQDLWRPDPERFPLGFKPVADAASEIKARLGLWMSPVGGYPPRQQKRLRGSLGGGFEKNLQGFCIAGDKHGSYFAQTMAGYVRDYGVNYYKLDNITRACPNPLHGHRVGKYEQAGLTDRFIEVMQTARQADPKVMINITVGSWLSPWWLLYCDVAWRGGMDFGFWGEGSQRQQSITYVDKVLQNRLREEMAQFPLSSLMTHGVILGRQEIDRFGGADQDPRDFADDVWMYFGRGVMMQELYLSPDLLTPELWNILATAISFSREKWDILCLSEMVLGNPEKGQIYGFRHRRGGETILVIRNPSGRAQYIPAGVIPTSLCGSVRENPGADKKPAVGCVMYYSSSPQPDRTKLEPFEVRVIHCPPEVKDGDSIRDGDTTKDGDSTGS